MFSINFLRLILISILCFVLINHLLNKKYRAALRIILNIALIRLDIMLAHYCIENDI